MKRLFTLFCIMMLVATTLAACGPTQQVTEVPTVEPKATEVVASATEVPATEVPAAPAPTEPMEIKKIRFATLPNILALPFYYMHEMGWDVENGFELEITTYPSGAPINEALGAKLWDVTAIGAAGLYSLARFDAIHVLEHSDAGGGGGAIIRVDSPIASVKGYNPDFPDSYGDPDTVKGSEILVPVGTGSQMQILLWLEQIGLTSDDVSMIDMSWPLGYQAFTAGQADIVSSIYPQTPDYLASGEYMFASTFATTKLGYYDNVVVAPYFYNDPENWDVLVNIITQVLRADDAFAADEDLYLDTLIEWYKLNGKEVDREVARGEIRMKPFVTSDFAQTFENGKAFLIQADFAAKLGNLTPEELQKVKDNTRNDLLEAALVKMGK